MRRHRAWAHAPPPQTFLGPWLPVRAVRAPRLNVAPSVVRPVPVVRHDPARAAEPVPVSAVAPAVLRVLPVVRPVVPDLPVDPAVAVVDVVPAVARLVRSVRVVARVSRASRRRPNVPSMNYVRPRHSVA